MYRQPVFFIAKYDYEDLGRLDFPSICLCFRQSPGTDGFALPVVHSFSGSSRSRRFRFCLFLLLGSSGKEFAAPQIVSDHHEQKDRQTDDDQGLQRLLNDPIQQTVYSKQQDDQDDWGNPGKHSASPHRYLNA